MVMLGPRCGGEVGVAITLVAALGSGCGATAGPRMMTPIPGVELLMATEHYDVAGSTARQLAAAMAERGPVVAGTRRHAATEYDIKWEFQAVRQSSRCRARQPRVVVTMKTILPEWTGRADASGSIGGAWDRFYAALDRHEAGHRERNVEGARQILQALRSAQSGTCQDLQRLVRARTRSLLERLHEANIEYDRVTQGGSADGVVWPPPPPRRIGAGGGVTTD